MAIPCVNYYDNSKPPACMYSAKRIPTDGVNLELDTNFLCGCDCDDDCLVRKQLSYTFSNDNLIIFNAFRSFRIKQNVNVFN